MSEPEVECIGELTRQEKDAAGWAGAIDLDTGGVDPPTSTQQPVVVVKEEGTALSASAGIEPGNRESVDRETQRAVKKDAEAPQQPKVVVVVKKEGPAPAHADVPRAVLLPRRKSPVCGRGTHLPLGGRARRHSSVRGACVR